LPPPGNGWKETTFGRQFISPGGVGVVGVMVVSDTEVSEEGISVVVVVCSSEKQSGAPSLQKEILYS